MHTRQSGAAHVPILFFLLLLVMFLGVLGYAYVTQTKNADLLAKNRALAEENDLARGAALLREHLISDLGEVLAKNGTYTGRDGVNKELYKGATLGEVANITDPKAVREALRAACAQAEVAEARGIDNTLGALVTRVHSLNDRVKDLAAEHTKALAEKAEIDRKFQAASVAAAQQATDFRRQIDELKSGWDATVREKNGLIALLQENLKQKADQMASAAEAAAAKEKQLDGEINKLRMHNTALVSRESLRQPADKADGKVTVARNGVPTAFINLGRKDLLQEGVIFRVRNPNSDKVKAYATVTRVEQERAEVALSGVVDPIADSVREGDLLYNDLYTPGMARTIYLMGGFNYPYNKPQLEALLRNLGNKVVSKMGPGVDTVILGDNPINEAGDGFLQVSESVEYKEAVNLGVEFAPLRKIRDLIRLNDSVARSR